MSLTVEDRLDIQQLINLYGHLIDTRAFSRLGEIFTDDAVFDLTGFDGTVYEGLEAIVQMMHDSEQQPRSSQRWSACAGHAPEMRWPPRCVGLALARRQEPACCTSNRQERS